MGQAPNPVAHGPEEYGADNHQITPGAERLCRGYGYSSIH